MIWLCWSLFAADINVWELDLNFCGWWNKLSLTMDANTSTGLCMNLTNLSSKKWTIALGLVDGEMSQGNHPVQACKTSPEWLFWQAAVLSWTTTFIMQPHETIQRTATVTLPTGFAGNLYGCVTYSVLEDIWTWEQGWQMFSIISRKANIISILVSGQIVSNLYLEEVWWSIGNNPLINITRNGDGTYVLSIKAINKWTTNENINADITINDGFFFSKELSLVSNIQIYSQEEKEFKIELGKLPRYGWQYTIVVNFSHTPVDIQWTIQWDTQLVHQKSIYEYGVLQYWLLPLLSVAFIILILLFFIERRIIKKRKQKKARKKTKNESSKKHS